MSKTSRTTRSVLISGASTGIGRATALHLAARGWYVLAGVRQLADAPDPPAGSLGSVQPVVLDVTEAASVEHARDQVLHRLGGSPLGTLINNAGIGQLAPMETVELSALQAIWEVNVLGVVRLTQAFLPTMAAGSRLVVLGSIGDRLTVPFGGPLTSSKWAAASIAEAFRLELVARGIPVTLVEPGSIRTDAVAKIDAAAAATATSIDRTDAALAERFRRATAVALANERRGSDPVVVAHAIRRVLDARRPPSRVLVGKHAHLLATAAAVLPDPVLDPVRLRLFGQSSASSAPEATRPVGAAVS